MKKYFFVISFIMIFSIALLAKGSSEPNYQVKKDDGVIEWHGIMDNLI